MTQRFTSKAESALRAAADVASSAGHTHLGSEHLLYGLASVTDGIASRLLEGIGIHGDKIRDSISLFAGNDQCRTLRANDMTPRLCDIIEAAGKKAAGGAVGTEHLLDSLLHAEGCIAKKILASLGADVGALIDDLDILLDKKRKSEVNKRNQAELKKEIPSAFGRDLTQMAAEGLLDPVIGRDREIERVLRILTRRRKNNPCLIGDPGVGKTAVIEGLATRIHAKDVPQDLLNKRIFSLDMSALVAGAKYRGEFEERMKDLLGIVKADPNTILFIDEIHTIVGAGGAEGAIDAANILKPAMARGEIRVIGATTVEEYRAHIERDAALERRFQPLMIEAPSGEEAKKILMGLRERYEAHHGLSISEEALDAAIELSVRYLPERHLPDKALDLLDEAAADVRMRHGSTGDLSEFDDVIIEQKKKEREDAILAGDYARATILREELRQILSQNPSSHTKERGNYQKPSVTAADIAAAVSEQTGIPVNRLSTDEERRLLQLESELSERVIGQPKAIRAVVRAIHRSRTGIAAAHRPTGSFLFLGPTGVGKTELCRVLAGTYFGSEDALLRFDMSEYMEKHSLSRLIGSPPGYVGYEEEGQLSAAIRRRPYAVVLFDEMEKAHPDISNLLLQILDDGTLTDAKGRRLDFSNSIVIMTANICTGQEYAQRPLGFANIAPSTPEAEQENLYQKELQRHFRPELLNRIDEIVAFRHLSHEDVERIAKKLLHEVLERIRAAGYALSVNEDVAPFLAAKGYERAYGARAVRRAVSHLFEDSFSLAVLDGRIKKGESTVAIIQDDEVAFQRSDGTSI